MKLKEFSKNLRQNEIKKQNFENILSFILRQRVLKFFDRSRIEIGALHSN
jgi:hypothetical protein